MISTSDLATRARNLGVPAERVCRECLWPKTEAGECVSAAERKFREAQRDGPVSLSWRRWLREAFHGREGDAVAFSPCSRERPRIQRVRLETLNGAISTLSLLWSGAIISIGPQWWVVPVADVLQAFRRVSAKRDGGSLQRALTGWCGVRDASRAHYPPEVIPALDAVHAAWVAYKEVA